MKQINDFLRKNEYKPRSYKKLGKNYLVETNRGLIVIKPKVENAKIIDYLRTRNFNYYPTVLDDTGDYELTEYINEASIPADQKIMDLIQLTALLHSKTTHYKEVDEDEYKKLYEDISNNIEYLFEYYFDIITIIESKVFMSPSEYLLARNISSIFSSLRYCKEEVEEWYKLIKEKRKMRVVVIHNNLSLDHYMKNEHDYLISWGKSKINIPIFDLYKLYNKHYLDFDFYEVLRKYESMYPLKRDERNLLFILINLPNKIEFEKSNYDMCKIISKELDKLYKSYKIVNEYKKVNATH